MIASTINQVHLTTDEPKKLETIMQIVASMKHRSPGAVVQGSCVGGWLKAWVDRDGSIWSQFKIDDGKSCPLQEPVKHYDPKKPGPIHNKSMVSRTH